MQELNLQISQTAGKIECNFEEIRAALAIQMSAYTGLTVTEDAIPTFKSDLATLRKIRKAIDDRRKELKNEFMEPYDAFNAKVTKLLQEIDKPINEIDSQIKAFDKARKIEKKKHITEIYNENIDGLEKYLPLESMYNEKWENKSYSDGDILYDIQEKTLAVKNDIKAIEALQSEIQDELLNVYANSGNNLSAAITRNAQYMTDKNKITEQIKKTVKEEKTTEESALKQLDNLVKTVKTVHIIINQENLKRVKEFLDFAEIKYQIMGE